MLQLLQDAQSEMTILCRIKKTILFYLYYKVLKFTLHPTSSFSINYSIFTLQTIYRKGRWGACSTKSKPNSNETVIIVTKDCADDDKELHMHNILMEEALKEARQAGGLGEVPIGAIVVKEEEKEEITNQDVPMHGRRKFIILSKGQNQIETINDASAHAELQALRHASKNIQNWRLINTTLYTTLEPCPMCLSAAQAFRVSKIVYGAPDLRLGAIETHIQLLDVVTHPFHDNMEVLGGVKREECSRLLIDFFRERRKQSKERKACTEEINMDTVIYDNSKSNVVRSSFRQKIISRIYQRFKKKCLGRTN